MLTTCCSYSLDSIHVIRGSCLGAVCRLSLSRTIVLAKFIIPRELRNASLIAHLWGDFSCIQLLQSWAIFETELNVALLIEYEITI